jgi:hypothetical protein
MAMMTPRLRQNYFLVIFGRPRAEVLHAITPGANRRQLGDQPPGQQADHQHHNNDERQTSLWWISSAGWNTPGLEATPKFIEGTPVPDVSDDPEDRD